MCEQWPFRYETMRIDKVTGALIHRVIFGRGASARTFEYQSEGNRAASAPVSKASMRDTQFGVTDRPYSQEPRQRTFELMVRFMATLHPSGRVPYLFRDSGGVLRHLNKTAAEWACGSGHFTRFRDENGNDWLQPLP